MSELTLRGRTALVTGASRGIGFAIARELARAGVRVGMVARTEADLRRAAAEIDGVPLIGNVTSTRDVDALVGRVREAFGNAPDFLVNSAGAFGLAPFEETEPADFDRQIAVNLRGPFLMIRAFLPGMKSRRSGHIVNVGSVAGRHALPGNAGYSASKFGLRGMHEVLAVELRGTGVRATLVEPAATDTPLWDPIDPDRRDDLPSRADMLRPDDVARAVRFALEQPATVQVSTISVRAV